MTSPRTYTSRFSIPYSPLSPLNTLDIHTSTSLPTSPSYNLIYIHGGAFRDPLITSQSLLSSLPNLFGNPHIACVASLNYRLSPYPSHPTHPSSQGNVSRNVKWPDYINDVRSAIDWLHGDGGWKGRDWIVVGHSVGGTMAMMLALQASEEGDVKWGAEKPMPGLKAVISIEGIFDFVALRGAHLAHREIYEAFITAAFGPEEGGGWERGNVLKSGRDVREGVDVVLVVQSRGDELVEWGQAERMVETLEKGRAKSDGLGVLVEVEGGHDGIVGEGKVIGMAVERAVDMLVERQKGGL